jgi:DNA-binding transcriptional MerR regulator
MKKEELLHITGLTESKLRHYVRLGLIVSTRKGNGRAKGLSTDYHDRSFETVTEIKRLKGIKLENLIFVLYWKGYPIVWDKLKEALRTYVSTSIDDFEKVANVISDPDNAEEVIEKLVEDAKPILRPGRPSKTEMGERDKRKKDEVKLYGAVLNLIQDLAFHKSVSVETMNSFLSVQGMATLASTDPTFDNIADWPNLQQIHQAVLQSEENDYAEILEIIRLMQNYWSLFVLALQGSPRFTEMIVLIEKLRSAYPEGIVSENPGLIRYILLMLFAIKNWTNLLEFLQSDMLRETFALVQQQISNAQEANVQHIEGR